MSNEPSRQQQVEGLRLRAAYESRFPDQSLHYFAELVGGTKNGIKAQADGQSYMRDATIEYYGKHLGYDPKAFAAWIGEGIVALEFAEFEKRIRTMRPRLFSPDEPPTRGASRSAVPRSQPALKVVGGRG